MTADPPAATSLGQLLIAFAFAGDLAMGLELEDGLRCTYAATSLAQAMGLTPEDRASVYYMTLLKDAGCTCWTTPFERFLSTDDEIEARRELFSPTGVRQARGSMAWLARYTGTRLPAFQRVARMAGVATGTKSFLTEGFEATVEACARITRRLGLPDYITDAGLHVWEQWDGKGFPEGLKGEDIPLACRIVYMASPLPALHRSGGAPMTIGAARMQRGKAFDPRVADAFVSLAEQPSFWEGFTSPNLVQTVLDLEPAGDVRKVGSGYMDDVTYAFADFVDLKSPFAAAHSRRVARITQQLASLMGCAPSEAALYRQAGLVHDLGLSAVPSAALNLPESALTSHQREQMRLHPYYAERILGHTPGLSSLLPIVSSHHERMDGKGYYRGLRGADIPLGARLIAVANRLDELTHVAPGTPALTVPQALASVQAEAGDNYDAEVVRALASVLNGGPPVAEKPAAWPAGLTDREVEVLRASAAGLTRKEVARSLSISEATVRHHLEHIYEKTGATTRVGAIMFAMENDLLE